MEQIVNPAGLRVLESLIQFVRNADEIENVLTEIHRARDEANAKIRDAGQIEEIERLKSEAATALVKAEGALAEAKQKAGVILGRAGTNAAAEKARQNRADAILAAADARAQELNTRAEQLAAGEQRLQERMDAARNLKSDFNSLFK